MLLASCSPTLFHFCRRHPLQPIRWVGRLNPVRRCSVCSYDEERMEKMSGSEGWYMQMGWLLLLHH